MICYNKIITKFLLAPCVHADNAGDSRLWDRESYQSSPFRFLQSAQVSWQRLSSLSARGVSKWTRRNRSRRTPGGRNYEVSLVGSRTLHFVRRRSGFAQGSLIFKDTFTEEEKAAPTKPAVGFEACRTCRAFNCLDLVVHKLTAMTAAKSCGSPQALTPAAQLI